MTDWFLYRLLPPRPDFAFTMDEREAAAMAEHAEYWRGHLAAGRTIFFGPVGDAAGVWGMAVVRGSSAEEVARLGEGDPAVRAGVARFDVLQVLAPVTLADEGAALP
ncbi:YciI family protein [Pseudonocardia pini]|uniref:YciI family protein n=1 Tax=Pseudonocardia pini TaxID=2758030 RepID=UPI0015EFF72A|nr:YciI family protein [Pseudonocardia pini]